MGCCKGDVGRLCIAKSVALMKSSTARDMDIGGVVFLFLSPCLVVSGEGSVFNIVGSVRAASSFILKILPSVFSYS